jgi:hypothetical protein
MTPRVFSREASPQTARSEDWAQPQPDSEQKQTQAPEQVQVQVPEHERG